jgi:hypothetical protein
MLRSLRGFADYRWEKLEADGPLIAPVFNPRDAQMGENMVWLAKQRYPKRKIIVWAATMHIARDVHTIDTGKPTLSYRGVEPMGHHLYKALGKDMLAFGFTAHSGRAGSVFSDPHELQAPPEGSLEDLCVRASLEQAVIDLRPRSDNRWLQRPLFCRPLGYSPMRADWGKVVDVMVFQRTMTPSTRRIPPERLAELADLPKLMAQRWTQVERSRDNNPYVDKISFTSDWEDWWGAMLPSAESAQRMVTTLETWAKPRHRAYRELRDGTPRPRGRCHGAWPQ